MITCPECGQAAPDDAKFCDRCGQGLAKSVAPKIEYMIGALQPGTVVRGEFRIVEVLGRSALENRYRAEQARDGAGPSVCSCESGWARRLLRARIRKSRRAFPATKPRRTKIQPDHMPRPPN